MNEHRLLALALALALMMALVLVSYPDVQSAPHVKQKWKAIPICKTSNGTKTVTHHETEGNATKHATNCA